MDSLSVILSRAQLRAQEKGLAYQGCLTPAEANQVLQLAPAARLVDVRSREELDLVGKIPEALHIEWSYYPDWNSNPDFVAQLQMQVDKESLVMFICRSGVRSSNAAAAAFQHGYSGSYNVLEGFEGEVDVGTGQRGKASGWKAAGLPWTNK